LDLLDHWTWSNQGDSMCIFRPAMAALATGPWQMIICGHSHVPGIVRSGERVYANTGSWTFASSTYLLWDHGSLQCGDWITGRQFSDELYRPLIEGSIYERDFFQWWKENYMGWPRFREGEERHGRLRGWESYLRDHQYLAQLRHLPEMSASDEVPANAERPEEAPPSATDAA
jgi:hypothetical protein